MCSFRDLERENEEFERTVKKKKSDIGDSKPRRRLIRGIIKASK